MMIFSLHSQPYTTQYLRPALGFLHSAMNLCNVVLSGTSMLFGIREQGRKPSGIIWTDSLFGLDNSNYAPVNENNDEAADDNTRKRCRSHSERFYT